MVTTDDFNQLQRDLEHTVFKLKGTQDPKLRRDLLLQLRRLLMEADQLLIETPE
jgi:hypothetical protein